MPRLYNILEIVSAVKEITIPLGCAVAFLLTAVRAIDPPPSIAVTFGDTTTAWLWALGSFISYVIVAVGVIIKYVVAHKKGVKANDGFVNGKLQKHLLLEYPGLIAASLLTLVYALAIAINLGLPQTVLVVYIGSIAAYFLARWLILEISRQIAKKQYLDSIRS
jgi:uncharacterized membrane protein YdjX (TVP38/TMEM64 family)